MNKKKKIIAGAAVCVVVAAGAAFFLGGKNDGSGAGGGMGGKGGMGGMPGETSTTVVKAAVPVIGDLNLSTSLTGTVEAADVVYVYAKASGDVTSVNVKAGDVVAQGAVLCEIDTEQVESAKNSMDSAAVSLSEAQSNLSRMQLIYNSGDLSEQEYEQYTTAAKSAQLQYESAKLSYDKQVEYSTITAPIAGTVESCDVEVYDRISQSDQLCVIAGEGGSRITFYVTQRMMQNLRVGDTLEVVKSGTAHEGNISEISSMVDSESGLFKVKAEMANTDEIAIGSTVKINLVTERTENAMLVPVDAIYYSNSDAYVYLDQDGVAKMMQVEVGLYDDQSAEILSGISADDVVVSTWSSNLYEGAKIRQQGSEEEGSEAAGSQTESSQAESGQAESGQAE